MAGSIERRIFLKGTAAFGVGSLLPSLRSVAGPPCDLQQLSTSTMDALAGGLSSRSNLLLPTDTGYTNGRLVWNAEYDSHPTAIVKAQSASDVAFSIGWCKDNDITPRIRCGGHSFAGYSTGGTLVIDVSDMKQVTVGGNGVAEVQSGANLGHLYASLRCPYDRVIPGGTCKPVGISGLTMAGGMGRLMREHGLTIDSLVEAEVVLADGSVIRARKDNEHHLLFWALCGGGSGSYGVVTRWWFNTIPLIQRQISIASWHWESFVPVFVAWEEWLQQLPATCYAGMSIISEANDAPHFQVCMFGDEGGPDLVSYLHDLGDMSVPIINNPRAQNWRLHSCDPPEDNRQSYGFHKSRLTNTPIGHAGGTALKQAFDMRASDPVLYSTAGFCLNDGLGGAIAQKSPSETAWVHREAIYSSQFGSSYNGASKSPGQRDACQKWIRDMYTSLESHYDAGCYQGYWDPDILNWQEMYYGPNYHKLQVAKSQYDPTNFFNFQRSIELL